MTNDDQPVNPDICGHGIGLRGAGFTCEETGDHDEHVWRSEGQASRGLGSADNLSAPLEIRWRDDRPAATVGDIRRLVASRTR